MTEGRIKCACGSRHATVAEVRECRGVTAVGSRTKRSTAFPQPSENEPPDREPATRLGSTPKPPAEPEPEGVDPLKCPRCANAWGRLREGTTIAICEECLTPWDTATPPPRVTFETVYTTQNEASVYHATRFCTWLEAGQQDAEDRGWERRQVISLSRQRARSMGKAPCRACTPRTWKV